MSIAKNKADLNLSEGKNPMHRLCEVSLSQLPPIRKMAGRVCLALPKLWVPVTWCHISHSGVHLQF